jgi:hypothetical protein
MKRELKFLAASALLFRAGTSPSVAATGIGPVGASTPPAFPTVPGIAGSQPSSPSPPLSPAPQSPSVVSSCNGGGYMESNGNSYTRGIGKLCVRTGVWMQCG